MGAKRLTGLCRWSPVQGGDRQIIKRAQKVLPGRFSGLLKSPPKVPEKTSKRTPRADGDDPGSSFSYLFERKWTHKGGRRRSRRPPLWGAAEGRARFSPKRCEKVLPGLSRQLGEFFLRSFLVLLEDFSKARKNRPGRTFGGLLIICRSPPCTGLHRHNL